MDIMLRSIIWQLSGHTHSRHSYLEKLYKALGDGTRYPQPVELQRVLEDLLSELDRTYIVIDGSMNVTRPTGGCLSSSFTACAIPPKMHHISCLPVNLLRNSKQHSRM
jgi:hypothetical protein